MAAPEGAGLLAQRLDDLLDHLPLIDLSGVLIGQVRVLAAEKPNTQHDCCHSRTVVRPNGSPPLHALRMPAERRVAPHDKPAKEAMSHPDEASSTAFTPTWALQRATEELYDTKDAEVIAKRAREIAREGREHEDERHDEYDDPDEGGEA